MEAKISPSGVELPKISEFTEYDGWLIEPVDAAVERIFFRDTRGTAGKEAGFWVSQMLQMIKAVVPPVDVACAPAGIVPFGFITDGMSRQWHNPTGMPFEVAKNLERVLDPEGRFSNQYPQDEFYRNALVKLIRGPYDIDLKVVCDDVGSRSAAMNQIQENVGWILKFASKDNSPTGANYSGVYSKNRYDVTTQVLHHPNISVAKYKLKESSGRPLIGLDVTFLPTADELKHDYRRGPGISNIKQTMMYVGYDGTSDEATGTYVMQRKADYEENQKNTHNPTHIERPQYGSYQQALIAGLGAIWTDILKDVSEFKYATTNRIDVQSMAQLKNSLQYHFEKMQGAGEELHPSRIEEIIRFFVVALEASSVIATQQFMEMGILQQFFPDFFAKYQLGDGELSELIGAMLVQEFHEDFRNAGSIHLIRAMKKLGGFETTQTNEWDQVAEAFDIRRLQKK